MHNSPQYLRHARAILALGLPLTGSHLAQFAIHLTDTVMLGWYSVEALAAQVLGGMFFFVLFIAGSGFAWAVVPMVAAAQASGDETQVRRVTRMSMWATLGFGIAAMPLMIWSEPIFLMLGQQAETAHMASQYLQIAGWGLIPALMVMVLKSYLSALERMQVVLWMTVAAVGVNIVINNALIFGNWGFSEMGIRGAAIASLMVNIAAVVVLAVYVARALPEHAMFQRLWRPDWEALGAVFRLGWPISMTSLSESGLFAATSLMMGWLGTLQLAAHGIAIQVVSTVFMIHVGLSNAATIRAGQAMGRKDATGLRNGAKVAIIMAGLVATVAVVMFLTAPQALIGLFMRASEPNREAVIVIGVGLLAAAALFQVVDAMQIMALSLLRGMQDTRAPMVIAMVSYWLIGIPVSYVLGFIFGMGGVGIWLGLAVGLATTAVLLMWRFWARSARL
jgi:MATE family multidrug resistance protein